MPFGGALSAIGGAVAGSAISGLMGSGGSSSSRSIAPPTQEEIDIIKSLMAAGAPTRQTANISDQELNDAFAQRVNTKGADFLKTLPRFGNKYSINSEQAKLIGYDFGNRPQSRYDLDADHILALYNRNVAGGSGKAVDKGALRAELLAQKQAQLDKEYETQKNAFDKQQGDLQKNLAPSDADKQIQDLFRSKVTSYLSRKEDGSVDPAAFEAAKTFVDQTFTNPAEEQLRMAQSDFESGAAARNAALGRNTSDSAFQKLLFGNLANQRAQLGAQRGAMIADQYTNQPIRDIGVASQGLSGINAIHNQNAFAPSFLNALNQQATMNRLNLLNNLTNARTGNQTTSTSGPDIGIVGRAAQGAQLGQGIGDLISKGFQPKTQEYAPINSGAYDSAGGGSFWNRPNKYGPGGSGFNFF